MSIEIVDFIPRFGGAVTRVEIKLKGMTTDFTIANTRVYLGEDKISNLLSVDPASGTIVVLTRSFLKTGKFSVQGGNGKESATAADDFRVEVATELKIDGFNPTSGGPGTKVVLHLSGMTEGFNADDTRVHLGEEELHEKTVDQHSGTIDVTIDEMARTGKFSVQGGNDKAHATATGDFTVTGSDETTPTITAIFRQTGNTRDLKAGDRAVITGRNLDAVTAVLMAGRKCRIFSPTAETKLTFQVPMMMPKGQYSVSITFGNNQSAKYGRQIKIV